MKKLSFVDKFEIASTQFGAMLGAGLASGATVTVYYITKGGYLSPLMAIFTLILMFAFYFVATLLTRKFGFKDYGELYKMAYGRYGKFFSILVDAQVVFNFFMYTALALGGAGSYLNQMLGWPIIAGNILCGIVCFLIVIGGTKFFSKIQGIMSFIMFAILSVVFFVVIFVLGWDELVQKITTQWVPADFSVGRMFLYALMIAMSYISMISIYVMNAGKFNSTGEVVSTMGINFVLDAMALVVPIFGLIAFAPESISAEIPILYILTDVVKIPIATGIYSILLFFAFFTTGASCVVTMAHRMDSFVSKATNNGFMKKYLVPVILILGAAITAQGGLTSLYGAVAVPVGILGTITMGIPLVILSIRKLGKKAKTESSNQ